MLLRQRCHLTKEVCHLLRRSQTLLTCRQVGLGDLHCAVAGALSNVAVGIMRSLQYELAMDNPACIHFREIINQLVRDGNYTVIGATPPANTTARGKEASQQVALNLKGDTGATEESLLLTTHNDLVSFIIDYRKKRNGKPSSIYAKMDWNPNFRDTQFTLVTEMTPQNIRKWKAEYTVSWLYDLVNTYAIARLSKDKSHMQSPEKLDWNIGEAVGIRVDKSTSLGTNRLCTRLDGTSNAEAWFSDSLGAEASSCSTASDCGRSHVLR